MNKTQLQTTLAPVVGVIATYLATKYPLLDSATWNALVSSIAFAAVAVFIGFATKKVNMADAISGNGTTVVTDEKTANALPANPNVISNTENKVVSK